VKEGFYLVSFTGHFDSGSAIMVLDSGNIVGADVGGCQYDGIYQSNEETGLIEASITLTVPPGTALVVGVPAQSHEWQLKFTATFKSEMPEHIIRVETSKGPVNALIKFLRYRKRFPEEIGKISKKFIEIYEQAEFAEDKGLDQICGPGFRKALEFLIKDYCIGKKPESSENIKKKTLTQVIATEIYDTKIKKMRKEQLG
jgi:hypothetical protein